MFDFLFGGTRKLALIRELLEQRMRDWGLDDIESRLQVKQMSNLQIMGSPEAGLISIIESILKLQKQGLPIAQIIQAIENFRSKNASDHVEYANILRKANRSIDEAVASIEDYCFYRMSIEQPGKMTRHQFDNAYSQIMEILMSLQK
jgi:hypothetical protein